MGSTESLLLSEAYLSGIFPPFYSSHFMFLYFILYVWPSIVIILLFYVGIQFLCILMKDL